jgi:hypothetical protein
MRLGCAVGLMVAWCAGKQQHAGAAHAKSAIFRLARTILPSWGTNQSHRRRLARGISEVRPMSDLSTVQEYRFRADELRVQAAETKSAEAREQLLGLARQYDVLADGLERQRKPSQPSN